MCFSSCPPLAPLYHPCRESMCIFQIFTKVSVTAVGINQDKKRFEKCLQLNMRYLSILWFFPIPKPEILYRCLPCCYLLSDTSFLLTSKFIFIYFACQYTGHVFLLSPSEPSFQRLAFHVQCGISNHLANTWVFIPNCDMSQSDKYRGTNNCLHIKGICVVLTPVK